MVGLGGFCDRPPRAGSPRIRTGEGVRDERTGCCLRKARLMTDSPILMTMSCHGHPARGSASANSTRYMNSFGGRVPLSTQLRCVRCVCVICRFHALLGACRLPCLSPPKRRRGRGKKHPVRRGRKSGAAGPPALAARATNGLDPSVGDHASGCAHCGEGASPAR